MRPDVIGGLEALEQLARPTRRSPTTEGDARRAPARPVVEVGRLAGDEPDRGDGPRRAARGLQQPEFDGQRSALAERAEGVRRVQNSVAMLRLSAAAAAKIIGQLERMLGQSADDEEGEPDLVRVIEGARDSIETVHNTLETIADGLLRFYEGLLAVRRAGAGVRDFDVDGARRGAERLRGAVLREGGAPLLQSAAVSAQRALELLAPPRAAGPS